jgi:uncharacterized membrane protein YeiB
MPALLQTIASPPAVGPVISQERIEAIDILRGVAILGILIVNMHLRGFSLPEGLLPHELWPNVVDRTVETLISRPSKRPGAFASSTPSQRARRQ